jgi:signal transduction histidine kinase
MVEGLRERQSLREHNQELTLALRASLARVVAAANDERRRVERDIHDGAQQQLALIGVKLAYLERLAREDSAVAELAFQLRGDLENALAELRDLAHGIYPPLLESDGLRAALDEAVRRAPGPARLECRPISPRRRSRGLFLLS